MKEILSGRDTIILRHLQEHKKITSVEAFEKYKITRLSAVVYNLRRKGYVIDTELKPVKSLERVYRSLGIKGKFIPMQGKYAVYSLL